VIIIQTFLPYEDFEETAKCLDYRRLGKQRIEAKQIINLLEKHDRGEDISKEPWGNHPAVKMWMGCTLALKIYYNAIVQEWIDRGYKNTLSLYHIERGQCYRIPDVMGNQEFHDSHRSNLLRKDKEFYSKYGWNVPDDLKYIWRVKK